MGTMLSAAMMLRHSLELETEAAAMEGAVAAALARGYMTPDLGAGSGAANSTTRQVGDAVLGALEGTLGRGPHGLDSSDREGSPMTLGSGGK